MTRVKRKTLIDTLTKSVVVGIMAGVMLYSITYPSLVRGKLIDPTNVTVDGIQKTFSTDPTPTPTGKVFNHKDLTQYYPLAKSLFGKDWKIALAVAESECNSGRPDWPRCVNSWGDSYDEGEYSVGWGQVNLAKQSGRGRKVHWDKVPGKDLKEKAEWLKNPENNLVAMHAVYVGWGKSFNPWTGFTSGNFKAQLGRFK